MSDQHQQGPVQPGQGSKTYMVPCLLRVGWYIVLNPMMGNTESQVAFGPWPTKQALRDWYNEQVAAEPYSEDGPNMFGGSAIKSYRKVFKKGSALELCNPLGLGLLVVSEVSTEEWGKPEHHGHGVYEQVLGIREADNQQRVEV